MDGPAPATPDPFTRRVAALDAYEWLKTYHPKALQGLIMGAELATAEQGLDAAASIEFKHTMILAMRAALAR